MGIEIFIGKTLIEVFINVEKTEIHFHFDDGTKYRMYHNQDCCEEVTIYDINGDWNDLIMEKILDANESTNSEDDRGKEGMDSFTWTFYTIASHKGYVNLRWLGESNGYYSEEVEISEIK